MRLAQDVSAEAQARQFARSWSASEAIPPPVSSDIELVVAELVSNAVRYGIAPFDVELSHAGDVIRGEVSDGSRVAPTQNATPDERGGFGLKIVAACTSRWGTDVVPTGKQVWFEFSP
jgi:anti-sigma regulatory factor (Ser/Thr protein kinase)